MQVKLSLAALMVAAYLLGSIPFGLFVGLWRGIDPRKAGSGNTGATNLGRLLGGRYFALVFTLDVLKAALPTGLAAYVMRGHQDNTLDVFLWIAVGFCAILGGMFSLYLGFKGGKGVATSVGVAIGVWPYFTIPAFLAITMFVIVFKLTGYVSVASMAAAIFYPAMLVAIGLWQHWPIFGGLWPLLAFCSLVSVLIVYRHRGNIQRLRDGTEHRFGARGTAA
jgi:glycerol-3-phosphate acyltransferase PlsY